MVSIRQIEKGEPERIAAAKKRAGEPPNQTRTNYTPVKPVGSAMGFTMRGLPTLTAPAPAPIAELPLLNLPQMATGFIDSSGARVGGSSGGGDPTPRTPQLGDFKTNWKDPEYNAQIASLNKALQDYETGAQQRADRYGQDFRTGVQQMGYRPAGETGFGDVLATPEPQMASRMSAPTEPQKMGQWDLEGQFDPYSSAARGTRGLRDEFAARGTLRSSDFGQTFGEFQNRLSDQLDAMNLSRSRFGEDLQTEIAGQRSGTEERSQAAERSAGQRAATNQMNAYMRALAGG